MRDNVEADCPDFRKSITVPFLDYALNEMARVYKGSNSSCKFSHGHR
jgi:hypothetical protein